MARIIVILLACAACARGPVGVPAYPLSPEQLAQRKAEEAARPPAAPPGTAVLQMPSNLAFQKVIDILVSKNIVVASAIKDAGLIRTGRVIVPNINRSSVGLALKCGAFSGAGMASYDCMDFIAEYQILVRQATATTSGLTVSATVLGVDSRGVPLGTITDASVLNAIAERMKAELLQGLP